MQGALRENYFSLAGGCKIKPFIHTAQPAPLGITPIALWGALQGAHLLGGIFYKLGRLARMSEALTKYSISALTASKNLLAAVCSLFVTRL